MSNTSLSIVILGLSITSSWGNGHATTYRGLIRALLLQGHKVVFLERDAEWYASNRDFWPDPDESALTLELYQSLDELRDTAAARVRDADLVVVGSYVPDGVAVGEWAVGTATGVTAFYDIDTPVTLASLARGDCEYLSPELIRRFDLYLSFSGGPTLDHLEQHHGAQLARALYCSVDPALYYPEPRETKWDLGYLGTYSDDRQPTLERLLVDVAHQLPDSAFVVAGPKYPESIKWPSNVERIIHLPPSEHRAFYNAQRFTLNVTRSNMIQAGYSPSVRLFEAAACGIPIISDWWTGLDELFVPGQEIVVARATQDVIDLLCRLSPEDARELGRRGRSRILANHTADRRAEELVEHFYEAANRKAASRLLLG